MAEIPDQAFVSKQAGQAELPLSSAHSSSLSRRLLWFYTSVTIGSWMFFLTYLIEGATRAGYSAWQQSISALILGPGGLVQQVNFVFFGLVTLLSALAWRLILRGGIGQTWYPLLRVLEGVGLIADGIFSQDPAPGYPAGAILTPPTPHGVLHVLFDFLLTISIALSYFVLARRMARESDWGRGWSIACVIVGVLVILLIALYGTLNGQHSPIAGLVERLAVNGTATPLGLLILIYLWRGAGFSRETR